MEQIKSCFKCGNTLPLTEFYRHKAMGDGHLNKCKTCTKKDVAERIRRKKDDPEWVFNEKERCRMKSLKREARLKSLGLTPKYKRKWIDQDIKINAARAAQHLPRLEGHQNHHWSYQQEHWKDVIPFTTQDHAKIHRYMTYDEEHKQYRTVHGVLMDSRELAQKYYDAVLKIKDGVYSELQKLF